MYKLSVKFILMALVVIWILAGCGPKTTQTPPPPPTSTPVVFPTGVFTKANWTWEFYANGNYYLHSQIADEKGTYAVSGNQVTVQGDLCKDVRGNVIVATYTWAYDGQVLSFDVVEDKCLDRRNLSDESKWMKKP